jgi:hypothetical protein
MDALTSASSGEAVGLVSMAEASGNARKAAVVGAAASAAAVAAMASRASENESESGPGDSEDSSEDNSKDGDEDGAREGFRSALDESNESEENDFDEDESDDDTYDEGTHIQSVGTFEDTIADMNTEEAIAYVMAAAKRMEAESETADKSEDTGEFDRQMAAHQDPAPDMAGTDESEETSGDGEDTSSGDSDDSYDSEETSSGDYDDSEETSEEETSSEENSDSEGSGPNSQASKQGLLSDPSQFRRQLQIRQEVEELVRELVPEEVENLDAMFVQFAGREEELLNTLHTMRERRAKVRARAAVHKSKARPPPRLEQQRRRSSNGGPPPRGGAVDTQLGANLRALSSSEASGTTPVPTSSRSYGSSSGSSSSSSSGSSSGSSGSSSSGSGQSSSS